MNEEKQPLETHDPGSIRERLLLAANSGDYPEIEKELREAAEALSPQPINARMLAALKDLRAMIIGEHGASAYENVNGERADAAIREGEAAALDASPLHEDWNWAIERVTSMCASALLDAQVYRQKLLKGFGYPNETFARAQDYRALNIVLERLKREGSVPLPVSLQAHRDGQDGSDCSDINDPGSCGKCDALATAIKALSVDVPEVAAPGARMGQGITPEDPSLTPAGVPPYNLPPHPDSPTVVPPVAPLPDAAASQELEYLAERVVRELWVASVGMVHSRPLAARTAILRALREARALPSPPDGWPEHRRRPKTA